MSVTRNGMNNLGNTCYINSVLQCLRHSPIVEVLQNHPHHKKRELVEALSQLFETSQRHTEVTVRPISVVNSILSDSRNDFVQNEPGDAHELLSYLITTIHDQISKKVKITIRGTPHDEADRLQLKGMESFKQYFENEYSSVLGLFYGQAMNCIESCETPFRTCVFEPFNSLHIPIPDVDKVNLYDCLDTYFENERLEGDSLFHDDVAGRYVTAVKRHYIWRCPDVLAITLMRFRTATTFKNDKTVLIPELLNLSKYMHTASEQKNDVNLRLFATCNHMGSSRRGHYVAYCKDGNVWVQYDDEVVSVERSLKVDHSSYVLFYRKAT